MKLTPQQLPQHLSKQLAPIYFVSGDEPLLVQEACDAIRQQAQTQGYCERETHEVTQAFNWEQWISSYQSLSLFAEKRLIELRISGNKLGTQGSKCIKSYLENIPADIVLLIISAKLETSTQKTKWYQAIDAAGVVMPIWPIPLAQLPQWISQRLQQKQLQADKQAIQLIAENTEGNLLASAQIIEILSLLHTDKCITSEDVLAAISDGSRFSAFDLVDNSLLGHSHKASKILRSLREEGTDPYPILWALSREIRQLQRITTMITQGTPQLQAMKAMGVWQKRQAIVQAGLQRHKHTAWLAMLKQCAAIDQIIKGLKIGNPWDELLHLVLSLSGKPLLIRGSELI